MRDKALLAIVAFVAYVAAILTISTKCLDRQYYQPTSASTILGNFQLLSTEYSTSATTTTTSSSNGRLCDEESLEDYFRVRFHQEIQNLLNGNETEYVRQIKMIHSQRIKEDLEQTVQSLTHEFESKIASIESNNQQQILDMKNKYDSDSNNNDILFPTDRVGNYAVNMARVSRDSFNTTFFSSQFGYEFMESYLV